MSHFPAGAAMRIAFTPYSGKMTGENSLLQKVIDCVLPGEILLADSYYATFGNVHQAFKAGHDVVMRSHHRRKTNFRKGKKLGKGDHVVACYKPKKKPVWMSRSDYKACEAFVLVRHVAFDVKQQDFGQSQWPHGWQDVRSGSDQHRLPPSLPQLACLLRFPRGFSPDPTHLFFRRSTLKRHVLWKRSWSPPLENLYCEQESTTLLYKGAMQALNAFSEKLQPGSEYLVELEHALYKSIFEHPIGNRIRPPHPREIKRRPKPYKALTKPRNAHRKRAE